MKNHRLTSHSRFAAFAILIGASILFAGYLPGTNTAEAQTDLLLERRLTQVEQRFYLLESRLSRLEQTPTVLPQSSSRSDMEISLLRSQIDAERLQLDALRMRIDDIECGLARVDERTLTPAARDARRRSGADGTEQCRANPNAPVKLIARP